MHLLKDKQYMAEPLVRGHFIDSFRVAVASKHFVKVYSLLEGAFRIKHYEMVCVIEATTNLHFKKDLVLYSYEKELKAVVLEKLEKEGKAPYIPITLHGRRIECFCVADNGDIIMYDCEKVFAVDITTNLVRWHLNVDKYESKYHISRLEYAGGYVFGFFDDSSQALKIKVDSLN